MKPSTVIILVCLAGGLLAAVYGLWWRPDVSSLVPTNAVFNPFNPESTMRLTSSAFEQNGNIPTEYTCDGRDVSPPLGWSGVPEEAKSLVLICDDPDAPAGTWVHWVVWNIDSAVTELAAGEAPAGATEGQTSFSRPGYGGPCPPSGTHRYFFKLYALDTTLTLPPEADAGQVEQAIEGHVLDQTGLVGVYGRP